MWWVVPLIILCLGPIRGYKTCFYIRFRNNQDDIVMPMTLWSDIGFNEDPSTTRNLYNCGHQGYGTFSIVKCL